MNKNSFTCIKCFKVFYKKENYLNHINSTIICNQNTLHYKQFEEPNVMKNFVKNYFPNNTTSSFLKEHKCDYCNRFFKTKTYFNKHKKELCIRHKEFEQDIIKNKLRKINSLKIDNDFFREKIFDTTHTLPRYKIEDGKIIDVEINKIEYSKQKNINYFGKEILIHLNEKFMQKMIINPEIGLVNLVRFIHFNPNIPQNRNIYIKENIEIYQKKGWIQFKNNDAFQNLIASKKDIMDDWFDLLIEKKMLDEKYISKYELFSHDLDKYINHIVFSTEFTLNLKIPKLIYERMCKMIHILLLNNQKIEITYTPEDQIFVL